MHVELACLDQSRAQRPGTAPASHGGVIGARRWILLALVAAALGSTAGWRPASAQLGLGPAAPTDLRASSAGPTSILVTWTDNASDDAYTELSARLNGASSATSGARLPSDARSYLHEGLASGDYWCYGVVVYNQGGSYSYGQRASEPPYAHCAWAGGAPPGPANYDATPGPGPTDPATLWLWGANGGGQLGDGTTTSRRAPAALAGLGELRGAAALAGVTAVVKADGSVWTWGAASPGYQLGYYPSPPCRSDSCPEPRQVPGLANVRRVVASGFGALALDASGELWAWGSSDWGQLGNGPTHPQNSNVWHVDGVGVVVDLEGGTFHSIALTGAGEVWSWGSMGYGQMGDGTGTYWDEKRTVPARARGIVDAIDVAGGGYHSLALGSDGGVRAWGMNASGQLGAATSETCQGQYACSRVPVRVPSLGRVVQVAAGLGHSLALDRDGTVWAWGANDLGQLGASTASCDASPCRREPAVVPGLPRIAAVGARGGMSVAIAADGTAWGWGGNTAWQLGPPTAACGEVPCTPTPVRIGGLRAVRSFDPGAHVVALAAPVADSPSSTRPSVRALLPLVGR